MKFVLSVILIAMLSFAACLYLPWWSTAIAAFLVTVLIRQRPLLAALSGFVAILISWTFLAYSISASNGHILAHRVSQLILKTDNPFLLALVSGIIGGLVAGAGALTGSFVQRPKIIPRDAY
jgi:hypothetical protein